MVVVIERRPLTDQEIREIAALLRPHLPALRAARAARRARQAAAA
jgi:hypothetical protein